MREGGTEARAATREAFAVLSRGSRSFRRRLSLFGPLGLLSLIAFVVTFNFVEPPPPDRLRMGTGAPDGLYARHGAVYRDLLARDRIELELVASAGSVENLALLEAGEVDVAFVQGGVAGEETTGVESLASLYFEPLWVFLREGLGGERATLSDLAGARLAVGEEGSGTRSLALRLLTANGVDASNATLLSLGATRGAEALSRGEVDGLFLVTSGESILVRHLVAAPGVRLLAMDRGLAYQVRFRFLSQVVLGRGVFDLTLDIPSRSVPLVAPAATLVAREDLHPALVPVLLTAARQVHRDGGLFEEPGQFPAPRPVELPLREEARRFLENGPSFLFRVLPFWVASLLDRLKILLLPLLTLVFPIFKAAPLLYRWRIRWKIYRWYGVLRDIDLALDGKRRESLRLAYEIERLELLRAEVADVEVPLSYMEEFYNLRMHIGLVLERLQELEEEASTPVR